MMSLPASDQSALVVRSASSDNRLIERWLSRRSDRTVAAYRVDTRRFRACVPKALDEVSLADLEAFWELAPTTRGGSVLTEARARRRQEPADLRPPCGVAAD
jgi:hypothetical protein